MINFQRLPSVTVLQNVCKKGFQSSSTSLQNNAKINRQVKVFQKLLGNKQSGSKKRWFINNEDSSKIIANPCNISRTKHEGKNANRRITVLNKLFMKYITDLMAIGTASEEIVGKGVEVSRVKVTPDFQGINVYWVCRGTIDDTLIEKILNKSSGVIRHELSQLRLMGEVPRIRFVKDKSYAKIMEVETILKTCDFGDEDYVKYDIGIQTRDDLNLEYCEYETKSNDKDQSNEGDDDDPLPLMRHDVLGLNHKDILNKILTKMRKSKTAWDNYEQDTRQVPIQGSGKEMEKLQRKLENTKMNEEEFEKFLMRRKSRKDTPDRKKYFRYDDDVWNNQLDPDDDKNCGKEDEGDYIEEGEPKS